MSKLTVGVIFGSRSVEHDVAVVTATQVLKALSSEKYNVVPIYITRDGRWYTGPNLTQLRNFDIDDITQLAGTEETTLASGTGYPGIITPPVSGRLSKNTFKKLDVVFPVIHGSHGEDGTLQGLLEMVDLPYVGTGVLSSALANDKAMTKTVLKASGLPVIDQYIHFSRREWETNRAGILEKVEEIGYPVIVKPVTLGSSIGIAKIKDGDEANVYIDLATHFDRSVIVEKFAPEGTIEVNCAVLGKDEVRASTLEQPIAYDDVLDFEKKYMGSAGMGMKSQERIMPAPIGDELTEKIKSAAIAAFKAIRGQGTSRLDFLVHPASGQFWINEINTLPGSFAFYLWEPEGLSASDVCDELIEIALEAHAEKRQTLYNYKTNLIQLAAARGTKGSKSLKS
jgi:D-alanine-D-alanine ligase